MKPPGGISDCPSDRRRKLKDRCEKAEEKRKREAEEKRRYLEGIKRFQKVGVTVLVDGKEPGPRDLEKIVEIREDGAFYMGDYIADESGKLVEIRFDKVYHR